MISPQKKNITEQRKSDSYRKAVNHWLNSITQLGEKLFWKPVASFAQNGKQLRPELIRGLILSSNQKLSKNAICDAAALELIHVSTLVHDDIVDGSFLRRGHKTVNARFGNDIALFVGNLIKDHALSIASREALPHLNRASRDVNLGQTWETLARSQDKITVVDYFTISLFKTARIFRHSAEIAALYADRKFDDSSVCALELFALAYQALDDWRDLSGGVRKVGKTNGLDKQNNVHSFMYACWLKNPKEKLNQNSFVKRNDQTMLRVVACLSAMTKRPSAGENLSKIPLKDSAAVLMEFCEKISDEAKVLAAKDDAVFLVAGIFVDKLMKEVSHLFAEVKS